MLNQRWEGGRIRWRPDDVIDPSKYGVVQVPDKGEIEPFIARHHYEHSKLPSTRFRFLMVERQGLKDLVVGAANFGVPCHRNVIGNVFPMIDPNYEGVELNRLVLLDRVAGNGESWFVAEAFRRLKKQGVEGVVSFSDPVPRKAESGALVMPGHWGCVYQALNGIYLGRGSSGAKRIFKSDGTSFSHRSKTKASTGDVGGNGAIKQLCDKGASWPRPDEDVKAWLSYWMDRLTYRVDHPGCHKYAWAISSALRRNVKFPPLPYPKKVDGEAA